ncbi:MAG TPA: ATP-binding protein [Vicinamibacterales bacterium]|nr:ATP-binding protein [Vicinamibacterales bacterium]
MVLSAYYLSSLARVRFEESQAHGEFLADAIFHRAQAVVRTGDDPVSALGSDDGLQSILESSLYAKQLTYAAIVGTDGKAIAHSDKSLVGQSMPSYEDSSALTGRGPIALIRAVYTQGGKIFEIRRPLLLSGKEFGSIRVGVSTLLIRDDLDKNLQPALIAVIAIVAGASFVALLLAQVLLRPIHVIRSGITRLGRGEFGVMVDLPRDDEFAELGQFFNAVSARLSADRAQTSPSQAIDTEQALKKLTAVTRLSAGIAHELKNPLNAAVIHLELLKQQLAEASDSSAADHVAIIAAQMRRLDEVVQGFLRFIRPENLRLETVSVSSLFESIMPIVKAEADQRLVQITVDIPASVPDVRVDSGMMQQALLNLAINACQAMPDGGRLRLAASAAGGNRVEIACEDTGVGIAPDNLEKIFNLYFTTKEGGSGIGLSMVYRTVQLHDGELEVQSTPGHGTTFRMLLPQA